MKHHILCATSLCLLLTACDDPVAPECADDEQAMTRDANKEVIEAFVDEPKNAGDPDSVDRLTTEDFVQHFPDPSIPRVARAPSRCARCSGSRSRTCT